MDSSPSKILLIHRFVGKYPWKINRDKKKQHRKNAILMQTVVNNRMTKT